MYVASLKDLPLHSEYVIRILCAALLDSMIGFSLVNHASSNVYHTLLEVAVGVRKNVFAWGNILRGQNLKLMARELKKVLQTK